MYYPESCVFLYDAEDALETPNAKKLSPIYILRVIDFIQNKFQYLSIIFPCFHIHSHGNPTFK